MISPDVVWNVASTIAGLYRQAELDLMQAVSKRIARGVIEEGWNEQKLKDISDLRTEIGATVRRLGNMTDEQMQEAIKTAYRKGVHSAERDFNAALSAVADIQIPASVNRLVTESLRVVQISRMRILRNTEDAYRNIIAQTSTGVLLGTKTRRQVAQEALNRFADAGITGFIDKRGRRWDMASYAEMATRTTTGQAAIQGHIDRQAQLGRDLVVVSDHADECPKCAPWEGKILSLSGRDREYPSFDSARGDGLFHPNCRHTITGYIPGLTVIERGVSSPEGYKLTQQQRENERAIRKWKRREATAVDPVERDRAARKVREWQLEQRNFTRNYNLKRNYARESIARAH